MEVKEAVVMVAEKAEVGRAGEERVAAATEAGGMAGVERAGVRFAVISHSNHPGYGISVYSGHTSR